jgi:adenosine 3'-phospho 5'-phosphosulfate transporter B2
MSMMLGINTFSAALSMCMLLLHQQFASALQFLAEYPQCLSHIVLMSISSAMVPASSAAAVACSLLLNPLLAPQGQIFIYHTIATFGAVVFATLMTTRQLFSIVLSVFAFGK